MVEEAEGHIALHHDYEIITDVIFCLCVPSSAQHRKYKEKAQLTGFSMEEIRGTTVVYVATQVSKSLSAELCFGIKISNTRNPH